MACQPTLIGLPPEMKAEIVTHLEFRDTISLKSTCKQFYHAVPALNMDGLIAAERKKSAHDNDLWACSVCLRVRKGEHFADTQRNKRSKLGSKANKRFCIECGTKIQSNGTSRYLPGSLIFNKGRIYVVCPKCKRWGLVGCETYIRWVGCESYAQEVAAARRSCYLEQDVEGVADFGPERYIGMKHQLTTKR
ncbi:Uu.00g085070.m01.CDS01 [Anthostomella pinea]|uniref:Uu.00g085070.m01.CDS01 n=1 Tax=Anthostomella pinea TaxID=933095 RepID=A0AAI8YJM7_9PEZI|nr:Uu.00g085070.m01.CDS01 [Anthostomella pinea]